MTRHAAMTKEIKPTPQCARCGAKKTGEYADIWFRTYARDGETYCEFCLEDKREMARDDY